ncbi:MAG: O-antigen ligase family protein [Candidatus Coatesbacteria bacterium]|nr:O-antigen ligase family protein [Candidatus Coatesbacteria bacterium]
MFNSLAFTILGLLIPILLFSRQPLRNSLGLFILLNPLWISPRFHIIDSSYNLADFITITWGIILILALLLKRFEIDCIFHSPIFFLIVLAYLFIVYQSLYISHDRFTSIKALINYSIPIPIMILVMLYITENKENIHFFVMVFLISGIIYLFGVTEYSEASYEGVKRLKSFTEHPNNLGGYYDMIFPFCVYYFLNSKSYKIKILFLLLVFLYFYITILSGSRGATISIIIASSFYFYFFLKSKYSFRKRFYGLLSIITVILPSFYIIAKKYAPRMLQTSLVTSSNKPTALMVRFLLWGWTIDKFKPQDLKGGLGLGNYGGWVIKQANIDFLFDAFVGDLVHANQLEFQILFELGIAGLLFLLIFILYLSYMHIKMYKSADNWEDKKIVIAVFSSWLAIGLHSLIDYLFATTVILTQLFILLGITWGLWNHLCKPEKSLIMKLKSYFSDKSKE